MSAKVSILGWEVKVRTLQRMEPIIVRETVDFGIDTLHEAVVKNVSGPSYGIHDGVPLRGILTNAGLLPVPVVTGALRRSIKKTRISYRQGAVFSDDSIAPHNKYVHDGTRFMEARQYLASAVQERKYAIYNRWKMTFLRAIRRIGRRL